MPTTTIFGKKGGGKSYYGLRNYIMRELVYGNRVVCSTLALNLEELSAYLAAKYPHKDIDVNKRVRMLSREEGQRFWLHRQPGVDLEDVSDQDYDKGKNPDYSSVAHLGGVLYVIDEIHIDFDARNWAKVGRGLTYYNSQERKLQDDQVFITQFLDLVDKRVKNFSQEFVVCRNFKYEKFLTVFSKGSSMVAKHYANPPAQGKGELADETHRYKIEPDLARCYDTSQGVGFKGTGKPDTARKTKSLPWWLMFALPVAAWLALSYGTDLLSKAAGGTSGGKAIRRAAGLDKEEAAQGGGEVFTASPKAVASVPFPGAAQVPDVLQRSVAPVQVWVRGVVTRVRKDGHRAVNALLTDGRTLNEPDFSKPRDDWDREAVAEVYRHGIFTVGGRYYPMLAPKERERERELVAKASGAPGASSAADPAAPVAGYSGEALFPPSAGVLAGPGGTASAAAAAPVAPPVRAAGGFGRR